MRLPKAMIKVKRDVLEGAKPTGPWWTQKLATVDSLDLAGAQQLLAEASERFREMIEVQARGFFIGVQSL